MADVVAGSVSGAFRRAACFSFCIFLVLFWLTGTLAARAAQIAAEPLQELRPPPTRTLARQTPGLAGPPSYILTRIVTAREDQALDGDSDDGSGALAPSVPCLADTVSQTVFFSCCEIIPAENGGAFDARGPPNGLDF